jgi:hypothetical protein
VLDLFLQDEIYTMAKKPCTLLSMTGLNFERFDALLPWFETAHDDYFSKFDVNGKRRRNLRKYVIYSNSPLPTVAERLAFILSYQKSNAVQEFHADLFAMTQKQCNGFIDSLTDVLENALKSARLMPAMTSQELEKVLAELPAETAQDLFHDGTEREIPRPQDPDEQQEKYSGKKKNIP